MGERSAAAPGRGIRALFLTAAFLLVLLAVSGAIVWNMLRLPLFEDGLLRHADLSAWAISETDARAFAAETIGYLRGDTDVWRPVVRMGEGLMPIPETFVRHMATVRDGVRTIRLVTVLGAALLLALLIACSLDRRRRLSVRAYCLGAACALLVLAAIGLWAALDFDGLWEWLHRTFIPDGIFRSDEPVMILFPLSLFEGYIRPVGLTFAAELAALLALPFALALPGRLIRKQK